MNYLYCAAAIALIALFQINSLAQTRARDYVVQARAVVTGVNSITLHWVYDNSSQQPITGVNVYRKNSSGNWDVLTTSPLAANSTTYTDNSAPNGQVVEYQIERIVNSVWFNYKAYGYVATGINIPVDASGRNQENRGKVLIVHTPTAIPPKFYKDLLVGDGWTVVTIQVQESDTPLTVRNTIQSHYNADPSVKAVLLLGRVKVPYAGLYRPNGDHLPPDVAPPDYHTADHCGAWPADSYFGDMNPLTSDWTDTGTQTQNAGADGTRNSNSAGDEKWDQEMLPSTLELQVGRVDFRNLSSVYPEGEAALFRRYFEKVQRYRLGQMDVSAVNTAIADYWQDKESGTLGSAFALSATAYAHFYQFSAGNSPEIIPAWQTDESKYFKYLDKDRAGGNQGYLWSGAFGEGGLRAFTTLGGDDNGTLNNTLDDKFYIGHSADFKTYDVKSVFLIFGGSYLGDWDSDIFNTGNKPSFMRAALGSASYTLASAWAGRPHWHLHHMSVGETLGFAAQVTQNNKRPNPSSDTSLPPYKSANHIGVNQTHVALLGDPTLRMHMVRAPSDVRQSISGTTITITWAASGDAGATGFDGYYVYRATSSAGPFTRVSGSSFVTGTSYSETVPSSGPFIYMVRAVKREGVNGSNFVYRNLSTGVMGPSYLIYNVGTLGGQSPTWSAGYGINSFGVAVGHSLNSPNSGNDRAVRWTTSSGLYELPGFTYSSYAFAINDLGFIVGYGTSLTGNWPFRWNPTGPQLTQLGSLGGVAEATAINNNGVVVGYSVNTSGKQEAVWWNAGQTLANGMSFLPGYDRSYAYGINSAGKLVGRCIVAGGTRYRAFRTSSIRAIQLADNLGTLGGGANHSSEATAINDLDQIVGISHNSGGYLRAFLYQDATGFQDLGTLGGNTSSALGINNSGTIVGRAALPSGSQIAFVYNQGANGLQRLDAAIRRDSGFTWLEAAEGVNESGEIVGWGTGPYGYGNGFVLKPN